jgi:hypothetical protein
MMGQWDVITTTRSIKGLDNNPVLRTNISRKIHAKGKLVNVVSTLFDITPEALPSRETVLNRI